MELENGIPVTAGAGNADGLVERPAAELGGAGAFGEMEVDVVAGEVVAVAAGRVFLRDNLERGTRGRRCGTGQKSHVDPGAIGRGLRGEGIGGDEAGELFMG